MRVVAKQFFRRIPGAVGLNAMVAFAGAALFLFSYELLLFIKFLGAVRSLQILVGLGVLVGAACLFPRLVRPLWRRVRTINTAKWTGF
jgi:hypothetical protein